MAPPPGLFSTMTGWPRLSDNFCPNTRAMMSLPPPAAKPTMRWIGLAGYSWAPAGAVNESMPSAAPIRKYLVKLIVGYPLASRVSQPRHVNMKHGSLAVIERRKTAVDRGGELVRLGDAFAMGAE